MCPLIQALAQGGKHETRQYTIDNRRRFGGNWRLFLRQTKNRIKRLAKGLHGFG